MAEVTTTTPKKGNKKMIKKSTRVDLTPMVDLGFLLITFFVFTTSMATPKAMGMVTPNDKDSSVHDEICESCVITVIPADSNKLYYYDGKPNTQPYKETNYSATGLRSLLVAKKAKAKAQGKEAILIIQPSKTSTYKNLINVIDESNICMYKRYYLSQ